MKGRRLMLGLLLMVIFTFVAMPTYAKLLVPETHLVTTQWVAEHLKDPRLVLIDVRSAHRYGRGHLPGAVNISWKQFTDSRLGITRYITTPGRFETLMRYAGVNNNSIVVVYADTTDPKKANDAVRPLWTMYYYGMDNIAIMDGGITKWEDEGREVVKTTVRKKPGNFRIKKVRRDILATFDDILVARYTGAQIVDIRPPWYYTGVAGDPGAARWGHIPGAYDFVQGAIYRKVGDAYCYPTKKAVVKLARKVGLDLNKPIITYCNSGHCGSAGLVIFKFIGGVKHWALYDGSIYEYSRMPVNMKVGPKKGNMNEIDH